MKSSLLFTVVGLLGGSLALAAACSSDNGGTVGGYGGADGSVGGNAGSSTGGKAAAGGSSASSGTGGIIIDSGKGGTGATDAGCAATTEKADMVPLDLYVMLDKSGSMGTSGGWYPVLQAFEAFVNDQESVGIGVGMQFFPGSPECMVSTYSTPAVPIGNLPSNTPAIIATLESATPGGQTPTYPAMQGAIEYMTKWLLDNPTHTGVVVLATDGIPNNCASTIDKVAQLAQDAVSENPKILTFVIGVGSELTALNQIAQAGGTKSAFLVDTAGDVTKQFIEALNAIRGGVLGCEYLIPKPESGTIDTMKVNVQYTPSGGGDPETFPYVPGGQVDCPVSGDGWYYDNPAAPTKVILCPSSCTKVQADSGAQIGVAFGCETIIA